VTGFVSPVRVAIGEPVSLHTCTVVSVDVAAPELVANRVLSCDQATVVIGPEASEDTLISFIGKRDEWLVCVHAVRRDTVTSSARV